jgi:hypothetical protein
MLKVRRLGGGAVRRPTIYLLMTNQASEVFKFIRARLNTRTFKE